MSDSPFPFDHVEYEPNQPVGRAPVSVKVAAILNLVMAGLEIIGSLIFLLVGAMLATGAIPMSTLTDAAAGGPFGGGPPPPLAAAVFGAIVVGILSALTATLKIIAGVKLLRRGRGAWGCGLAAGIVGCLQPWCAYLCLLPMAVGIFTIVVMCLESTRRYFAAPAPAV